MKVKVITVRSKGFSIIELVISLAILSSVGLLVMATLTRMLRPSQKAADLSTGVVVAQSVIEEEIHAILSDTGAIPKATFWTSDAPPGSPITGSITVGGTDYSYQMEYQTVRDQTTGDPLGGTDPERQIKKVDITVWWWNGNPDDARDGYGQLQTQASQLFLYKPEQ